MCYNIIFLLIFLLLLFITFLLNLLFIIFDKGNKLENDIIENINTYGSLILNTTKITTFLKKKSNEQINYIISYILFLLFLLIIIIFLVVGNLNIIKIIIKKYKNELIVYFLLLTIIAFPFYLYNVYYTSKFFLKI